MCLAVEEWRVSTLLGKASPPLFCFLYHSVQTAHHPHPPNPSSCCLLKKKNDTGKLDKIICTNYTDFCWKILFINLYFKFSNTENDIKHLTGLHPTLITITKTCSLVIWEDELLFRTGFIWMSVKPKENYKALIKTASTNPLTPCRASVAWTCLWVFLSDRVHPIFQGQKTGGAKQWW